VCWRKGYYCRLEMMVGRRVGELGVRGRCELEGRIECGGQWSGGLGSLGRGWRVR
jgi:hypothetical protein